MVTKKAKGGVKRSAKTSKRAKKASSQKSVKKSKLAKSAKRSTRKTISGRAKDPSPFDGKVVLITGGTGSFGKSFAAFLLGSTQVKKLIIFSRDEFKQEQMANELNDPEHLRFFLGDVRDKERLSRALNGVDIVIHAAALKQVPTIEYNPLEAVKTNIYGSDNVIEASIDSGVERVLLISTDKAVQPVNLYGATKLSAEKLFTSGDYYAGAGISPRLAVVRYGNVLGSRGSIVEKLLSGKHIDRIGITHPDMTRFWITLEQSFNLVSYAIDTMVGGEVFVPKIPSMKITDLFDVLVPNAKKQVTGVRPGEKLHEILLTDHEARHAVLMDNYFVVLPEFPPHEQEVFEKHYGKYYKSGVPCEYDFCYTSDRNDTWLTKAELRRMIQALKHKL